MGRLGLGNASKSAVCWQRLGSQHRNRKGPVQQLIDFPSRYAVSRVMISTLETECLAFLGVVEKAR